MFFSLLLSRICRMWILLLSPSYSQLVWRVLALPFDLIRSILFFSLISQICSSINKLHNLPMIIPDWIDSLEIDPRDKKRHEICLKILWKNLWFIHGKYLWYTWKEKDFDRRWSIACENNQPCRLLRFAIVKMKWLVDEDLRVVLRLFGLEEKKRVINLRTSRYLTCPVCIVPKLT